MMIKIKDVFEIKQSYGLLSNPGVVVVLDDHPELALASAGSIATIETPAGVASEFVIDQIKQHGAAKSLLLKSATLAQVPSGSAILNIRREVLSKV